jgi:hypothetical protein
MSGTVGPGVAAPQGGMAQPKTPDLDESPPWVEPKKAAAGWFMNPEPEDGSMAPPQPPVSRPLHPSHGTLAIVATARAKPTNRLAACAQLAWLARSVP